VGGMNSIFHIETCLVILGVSPSLGFVVTTWNGVRYTVVYHDHSINKTCVTT